MEGFKNHIIPHDHLIDREARCIRDNYKSKVLWLTGLSGSGKSTLASALEVYFFKKGLSTYILDGDNIRKGINSDLDFSDSSRKENLRRVSEIAKLFVDANTLVITAFISPFKEDREKAKELIGEENLVEIYVECPLEVCERRDVKGLYKKARKGEIKNFTGINSPFDEPINPDVLVNTAKNTLEECLQHLVQKIEPQLNNE